MGQKKIVPVVLDTNVVVSGLLFGGTPGRLLSMCRSGALRPFLSRQILAEYLKVLAYPKFELTEAEINFLIYGQILPCFEVIAVVDDTAAVVYADPSDDKFLHCAAAARVHAIVSGDRHLLNLKVFEGIPIVTPVTMLRQLSGGTI